MTNNTINLSRELAVLLYRALNGGDDQLTGLEHAHAFKELRDALANQHIVCSNGILCQNSKCPECGGNGSYTRAALADPVPPEECVHDFRMFSSECAKCGADWIPGKDYSKAAPAVDVEVVYMLRNRSLGTTWRTADKEAYDSMATVLVYERRELVDRAHVTRLQAEAAQLRVACADKDLNLKRKTREFVRVQAELTKARDLLGTLASGRGISRCELDPYLPNQSAPAAKDDPNDCAHSEANKHGCPECGEEFKP